MTLHADVSPGVRNKTVKSDLFNDFIKEGAQNESQTFCKENLRKVQNH